LADFGPFPKREEKTKIRAEIDSHGTRDSDASTSPGGGAAGVPLRTPYRRADLRIAAAFGPRTPHILRRSCAVSLPKRALKTARSCYGPDVREFLPLNHAFQRSAGRQTGGDTVERCLRRERGAARARDRVVSDKEEGLSLTARSDRDPSRVEHVARAIPDGICRQVVPRHLWSGAEKTHTRAVARIPNRGTIGETRCAGHAGHARAAATELQ